MRVLCVFFEFSLYSVRFMHLVYCIIHALRHACLTRWGGEALIRERFKRNAAREVAWQLGLAKLREASFGSRQLKVAEMGGRAPKKRETARKRSAGVIDDQNWSKIAR